VTAPWLEVADIRRSFGGVPAVDGTSLTVSPGEIVGLIGPNGSGKSTTVNIISGTLRCDSGRVTVLGEDLTNRPSHVVARRGLARTFQIPRVWGGMTVAENLLVAGTPHTDESVVRAVFSRSRLRREKAAIEQRLLEILEVLGLSDVATEYAGTLSGGQKRLLEFGRIMISGTRVLVLDEPLAGVNPVMCRKLQDVVERFRDDGCAVLLIEHNLQAVEETADRVIVMALGKVIAQGSLASLRSSREVVTAYLGEAS
jgi:branched-chain amino acid transport system ATP-binding protein